MKRSSKIVIGAVVTLGLVGAVAAKQMDGAGCGFGPGGLPGGWISQKIAWRLDLNDAQRAEFDELREAMLVQMKAARQQRPSGDEIRAVMGAKLDQEKALEMLDERMQHARQQAPEVIAAFADFYDTLDADQKTELGEMIARRIEQGPRHRGGVRDKSEYREGHRGDQRGWDNRH